MAIRTIGDISSRALQMARMIDRLPAGNFLIELTRPIDNRMPWDVQINQTSTIRERQQLPLPDARNGDT